MGAFEFCGSFIDPLRIYCELMLLQILGALFLKVAKFERKTSMVRSWVAETDRWLPFLVIYDIVGLKMIKYAV